MVSIYLQNNPRAALRSMQSSKENQIRIYCSNRTVVLCMRLQFWVPVFSWSKAPVKSTTMGDPPHPQKARHVLYRQRSVKYCHTTSFVQIALKYFAYTKKNITKLSPQSSATSMACLLTCYITSVPLHSLQLLSFYLKGITNLISQRILLSPSFTFLKISSKCVFAKEKYNLKKKIQQNKRAWSLKEPRRISYCFPIWLC